MGERAASLSVLSKHVYQKPSSHSMKIPNILSARTTEEIIAPFQCNSHEKAGLSSNDISFYYHFSSFHFLP